MTSDTDKDHSMTATPGPQDSSAFDLLASALEALRPSGTEIMMTGWITDHPGDGKDISFLLLCPDRDGAEAAMHLLAQGLGVPPATTITSPQSLPELRPDALTLTVLGEHARLLVGGEGGLTVRRPMSAEWARIARRRGQVVLILGQRGGFASNDLQALERYLADPATLYMAQVPVHTL